MTPARSPQTTRPTPAGGARPPAARPAVPRVAPDGERRPGRPRSAEVDAAIVDAVIDVFGDGGYDGLTIEAVAERACVARSTVYRRYPGKDELLAGALDHLAAVEPLNPDTGSVEGDLLEIARGLRRLLRGRIGRTVPAALTAAARQPVVARDHRRLVALRRQPAMAAVHRGIERGELDPATDPELLVDLVSGTVFYRHFLSGGRLDDQVLRELVHRVVCSFRPSG